MSGSTRLKGNILLTLTLGAGEDAVDYAADLSTYKLAQVTPSKGGITTFADAASGGGLQWQLSGTAIQSFDTAAFWGLVWDNAGEDVPFTLAPYGNETPSATKPHFIGTCTIAQKPDIGGDAGVDNEFSFDFTWNVEGDLTKDTGEA